MYATGWCAARNPPMPAIEATAVKVTTASSLRCETFPRPPARPEPAVLLVPVISQAPFEVVFVVQG